MPFTGPHLLERARKYTDDTVIPYSVSDIYFYDFLTEAEREIAVAGKLLRSVDTYQVAENDRWVYLNTEPEVLEVRTATLIDGNRRYPLELIGTMDSGQVVNSHSDYGIFTNSDALNPGRPQRLIFGKVSQAMELSPPANKAYTIELSVIVYPEDPITEDTSEPSIPERHAQALPIGCALRVAEMEPFFDGNSQKVQTLSAAWARALSRAAQETGAISRDAPTVMFNSDYW